MSIRQGNKMIAGTGKPLYDWVGTLQQYMDLQISTNHPEWICYITDDEDGGDSVYTKDEVDVLVGERVLTGHEVIAFQAPTAENNYMWYRKYRDGWVEQGGRIIATESWGVGTCNLMIEMADGNYCLQITDQVGSSYFTNDGNTNTRNTTRGSCTNATSTSFQYQTHNTITWQVSGMAA